MLSTYLISFQWSLSIAPENFKKTKKFSVFRGYRKREVSNLHGLERTNVACGQLPAQSKHGRHKSNNQNTAVRSFF